VAVLVVLAMLPEGCSGGAAGRSAATSAAPSTGSAPGRVAGKLRIGGRSLDVADLRAAVAALCLARAQASSGPAAAGAVYARQARSQLRGLARAGVTREPHAAAQLRAAIAAVDQDFRVGTATDQLRLDLTRLIDVANALLITLTIAPVACEA